MHAWICGFTWTRVFFLLVGLRDADLLAVDDVPPHALSTLRLVARAAALSTHHLVARVAALSTLHLVAGYENRLAYSNLGKAEPVTSTQMDGAHLSIP
eukprot:262543-Chlamydomonas_euryale.AAC.8